MQFTPDLQKSYLLLQFSRFFAQTWPDYSKYMCQKKYDLTFRHEKDHRSGPKTRTGPDSGPSPRPKKISQNPRTCNGLGPIRVRSKSDSDLGYTQIQAG